MYMYISILFAATTPAYMPIQSFQLTRLFSLSRTTLSVQLYFLTSVNKSDLIISSRILELTRSVELEPSPGKCVSFRGKGTHRTQIGGERTPKQKVHA